MDDAGEEIGRWLARLGIGHADVAAVLAWYATRSAAELRRRGLALTEDDRLELVAWALALVRRRP